MKAYIGSLHFKQRSFIFWRKTKMKAYIGPEDRQSEDAGGYPNKSNCAPVKLDHLMPNLMSNPCVKNYSRATQSFLNLINVKDFDHPKCCSTTHYFLYPKLSTTSVISKKVVPLMLIGKSNSLISSPLGQMYSQQIRSWALSSFHSIRVIWKFSFNTNLEKIYIYDIIDHVIQDQ